MEDGANGQEGSGVHSLHGKGLGYYAPLLCERVQARGTTTYNDVCTIMVHMLWDDNEAVHSHCIPVCCSDF